VQVVVSPDEVGLEGAGQDGGGALQLLEAAAPQVGELLKNGDNLNIRIAQSTAGVNGRQ
jgi:hypothetical protein